MKRLFVFGAIATGLIAALWSGAAEPAEADFDFREADYFHRWSQGNQHEFTPAGQDDLEKWSDMITVNAYPDVDDGDSLAEAANKVLENYKNHQARILKTDSVPRTADRPAEHLIAAVFGRPEFVEVAFARFKLVEDKGYSFVYSHRIYGAKAGDPMSAWLKRHGAEIEKAWMEWETPPALLR